jgi:chlorobactene glucosyltransferase
VAGWRWLDNLSGVGLALSGGTLLVNLLWFRQPEGHLPTDAPRVSVLVPARNEARSIEPCICSLLAQDYPNFEVLVLDDGSEDETGAILARIQKAHSGTPTLRVLAGKPLPLGWGGKNWACHQLAQAADLESRFLLFTDADTVHEPEALRRAVAEALRDGLGLLSLMPEQRMETWAERLVVSLLPLQILGYLPLPAMEWLTFPSVAAANGQYLLFRREVYERFGGHTAYPLHLADDVMLARQAKARGGRVRLGNGAGLVRCRMYEGADEVVAGFRRSFAAGFRLHGALVAAMMAFNAVAYGLPFLRLPFSWTARVQVSIILALRVVLAQRTRTARSGALAHLPGLALLLGIQFLSLYDAFYSRRTVWRGRTYTVRDAGYEM